MWKAICPLLIVFLAAAPAGAAKTDIVVKDTLKLTVLKATAELPQEVEGAVRAGATEEEIGKSLRKMKEDKAEPEAAVEVARHFRKQAQERTRDHGLSDVVHACLAQGKRGTELVACVHEDWEKKPKVRKGGEGKPDEAGRPDDKGKPDEAGKPDDKGKPDEAGKPDDKGKPDEAGKPDDKGKPDEAGKPDDKGKPDEAGKPDDKGKIEDKGQPEGKGQPGGKGKQEGKGGH